MEHHPHPALPPQGGRDIGSAEPRQLEVRFEVEDFTPILTSPLKGEGIKYHLTLPLNGEGMKARF